MFPIFEHFFLTQKVYEKSVMPVCQAYGLSYMEFTVLMFLANNPQYDTAAQIVRVRRLTKSHVSLSLHSLQEKDLVEGVYHQGNRKNVHLRITPAAEPVIAAGREAQQQFGACLIKGFSPQEAEQLKYLIEKLSDNMKQEAQRYE